MKNEFLKFFRIFFLKYESIKIFVIVGLVFIPIGALIIVASNEVLEYETAYTDCTARTYWFAENREPPATSTLQ